MKSGTTALSGGAFTKTENWLRTRTGVKKSAQKTLGIMATKGASAIKEISAFCATSVFKTLT